MIFTAMFLATTDPENSIENIRIAVGNYVVPGLSLETESGADDKISDEAKELSGQHFYSRHLLRDRVNNGKDLYQGDEAFLAQYPKVPGYPHFFVLDRDGTFLHSQGTGELERDKTYDEQIFLAFLAEWAPKE